MTKAKILLVDDDVRMLELCRALIEPAGHRVVMLTDSLQALATIGREQPDLVITDLQMPGMDGLSVIREAKTRWPGLDFIVLTGHGSVDSAVEAMRAGAADYLTKPFHGDDLCLRVARALGQQDLTRENRSLRDELARQRAGGDIVGDSPAMQRVFATIERAAPTNANVLISGESGTGKEMVARLLHRQSPRAAKPFVAVDCVSLPDHLVESELFGHEKGAFTGAVDAKKGLLESANGGTLFLDEVTELSVELQGKLLRVLQERQFRRVGGRELQDLDIRVVAATNREPEQAVTDGRFRQDLFYRLNVIPILLPPLRHRPGDVIQLLDRFLRKFSEANGKQVHTIRKEALDVLLAYAWPGNVRELQNLVERLVILAPGAQIGLADLPDNLQAAAAAGGPAAPVAAAAGPAVIERPFKAAKEAFVTEFEVAYLTALLHRHGGNISRAAVAAGIDRKTIHRLVKAYNLQF